MVGQPADVRMMPELTGRGHKKVVEELLVVPEGVDECTDISVFDSFGQLQYARFSILVRIGRMRHYIFNSVFVIFRQAQAIDGQLLFVLVLGDGAAHLDHHARLQFIQTELIRIPPDGADTTRVVSEFKREKLAAGEVANILAANGEKGGYDVIDDVLRDRFDALFHGGSIRQSKIRRNWDTAAKLR